jgi:hypothetical protein
MYLEEDSDGYATLNLPDFTNGLQYDQIETVMNGNPSRPDRTLSLSDATANGTDDTFVDIQISLGGS